MQGTYKTKNGITNVQRIGFKQEPGESKKKEKNESPSEKSKEKKMGVA